MRSSCSADLPSPWRCCSGSKPRLASSDCSVARFLLWEDHAFACRQPPPGPWQAATPSGPAKKRLLFAFGVIVRKLYRSPQEHSSHGQVRIGHEKYLTAFGLRGPKSDVRRPRVRFYATKSDASGKRSLLFARARESISSMWGSSQFLAIASSLTSR
jgi:hypothetical protein